MKDKGAQSIGRAPRTRNHDARSLPHRPALRAHAVDRRPHRVRAARLADRVVGAARAVVAVAPAEGVRAAAAAAAGGRGDRRLVGAELLRPDAHDERALRAALHEPRLPAHGDQPRPGAVREARHDALRLRRAEREDHRLGRPAAHGLRAARHRLGRGPVLPAAHGRRAAAGRAQLPHGHRAPRPGLHLPRGARQPLSAGSRARAAQPAPDAALHAHPALRGPDPRTPRRRPPRDHPGPSRQHELVHVHRAAVQPRDRRLGVPLPAAGARAPPPAQTAHASSSAAKRGASAGHE